MTPLEQRYRWVLRLLPAYYRQDHEDRMVSTFMADAVPDEADEADLILEHGRPAISDVAGVAWLAIRLRLGAAGASPRHRAWGGAVRRIALLGMLVQAVFAVTQLALGWLASAAASPVSPTPDAEVSSSPGWLALLTLLWVPAYLSLVRGHHRFAGVFAMAALVPAIASFVTVVSWIPGPWLIQMAYELLLAVGAVLALAAFVPGSAPLNPTPWFAALPGGILAVSLLSRSSVAYSYYWAWVDYAGIACVLFVAAGLAYLIASSTGRGRRNAPWTVALAVTGLAVLGLRLVSSLPVPVDDPLYRTLQIAGVAEALVVAAVTITLLLLARAALRALPAATGAQATR